MADIFDDNGGARRFAVALYRAAVIGLMAICGYFLRDLHEGVKSTGINVGMVQTQLAVLKAQADMQFDEMNRRLARLERADDGPGRDQP